MPINLVKEYGKAIATESVGNGIYQQIRSLLNESQTSMVEIDFTGVITITTFCAKQIFGRLYNELGPDVYRNRISIVNESNYISYNIQLGITNRNG